MGQAAGLSILDPPGDAKRKLLAVIGPGERSERVADLVACLVGLSETQAPVEESFWALRRFLEILATPQPLLLLLDDLQWAESTFLDLVEHVAEWSRDAPILVLAQARPELRDDRPGWGGGVANATSILLEPLTEPETVRLVADLIGDVEVGRRGVDARGRGRRGQSPVRRGDGRDADRRRLSRAGGRSMGRRRGSVGREGARRRSRH